MRQCCYFKRSYIVLLLGFVLLTGMIWELVPPKGQVVSYQFVHEEGFAWSIELPNYSWFSDSMMHPQMSPLNLLEDGDPLAVSHCEHKVIKAEGMGCYSHWGKKLYFATTDNSDPNQNGRVYEVVYSYVDLARTTVFLQTAFLVLTVLALSFVVWVLCGRLGARRLAQVLGWSCVFIATVLLATNLYGSLRGGGVYPQNPLQVDDAEEDSISSFNSMLKMKFEEDVSYFERLSRSVYNHMILLWSDEYTRVPVEENYILFFLSYLYPDRFSSFEFVDPELALERRYSICSQSALVVYQVLEKQNIPAKMVGLDGHVVASARDASGSDYILDPYVGIVIPYGIDEIEDNPSLVEAYYDQFAGSDSGYGKFMARYYERTGNNVYDMSNKYLQKSSYIERISYLLKWLFPMMLLVLGGILVKRSYTARDAA